MVVAGNLSVKALVFPMKQKRSFTRQCSRKPLSWNIQILHDLTNPRCYLVFSQENGEFDEKNKFIIQKMGRHGNSSNQHVAFSQ